MGRDPTAPNMDNGGGGALLLQIWIMDGGGALLLQIWRGWGGTPLLQICNHAAYWAGTFFLNWLSFIVLCRMW